MTLTKAERDADRASWNALDEENKLMQAENAKLRARCEQWQDWYSGVVEDFVGLTTDRNDPDKLHDWEWMDDYRPAPYRID